LFLNARARRLDTPRRTMKIKLESKQGVEVLADTLDETLDALHVRPAPVSRRSLEVTSARVASERHFGEAKSHSLPRSPAQEHDASTDPRVANLLQRQSFTAFKERILTCLVHNTTVPGGIRCVRRERGTSPFPPPRRFPPSSRTFFANPRARARVVDPELTRIALSSFLKNLFDAHRRSLYERAVPATSARSPPPCPAACPSTSRR
jgi:hypothetical protein